MVIVVLGCNTEPGNPDVTLHDRIVFMGDITSRRIVHMRPDGTDRTEIPVTIPNDFARDLEVSPDGRQVLFAAQHQGGDDIFVVNADGTGLTNLTRSGVQDAYPAWSPDGTRIAWSAADGLNGDVDIFIMSLDGTGRENVTSSPGTDNAPDWSPDGTTIAFDSDRAQTGELDIYLIDLNTRQATRLTDSPEDDQHPDWAPNGSEILFSSERLDGIPQIYRMSADGSAQVVVSETFGRNPHWSPDGRRLTYGSVNVYVAELDGSGHRLLAQGSYPAWGPGLE